MSILKKMTAVLLVAVLLFSFAACSDDSADAVIRVEIDTIPKTLDPQLASSESELLAVRNLYEGLFRMDANGNAVKGVCTDYEVSGDGLNYTFYLNEKAVWKDDTPITAHDFVYGLRRAVSPITKAPQASTLACIENAPGVMDGSLGSDQLGVTAVDDHTLTIRLSYENPEFLEILASPIAMPCNEAFFVKAAGKYGLERTSTLTNGSFRVYSWQEKQMRLNRCTSYAGENKAKCAAAVLSLADDDTATRAERIASAEVDLGRLTDGELLAADETKLTVTSFEDVCYMLMINPESSVGNTHLVSAWSRAFDRSKLSSSENPYLTVAERVVPSALTVGGAPYDPSYAYAVPYDPQGAKATLIEGVGHLSTGKLPAIDLLYPDIPGMKEIVTSVATDWQANLGAYVNVVAEPTDSLLSRVDTGDYQMAVVPISSAGNSVTGFFENFATEDVAEEPTTDETEEIIEKPDAYGFTGNTYRNALKALEAGQYGTNSRALAAACEQLVGENPYLIPLVFGQSHFAASGNMKSVRFSLTGGICDLASAVKKG